MKSNHDKFTKACNIASFVINAAKEIAASFNYPSVVLETKPEHTTKLPRIWISPPLSLRHNK